MKKKIYKITGMHCASCSQLIEKTLPKENGVVSVSASYANEKAAVEFDENVISEDRIISVIESIGFGVVLEKAEAKKEVSAKKKDPELIRQKNMVHFIIPLMILSLILMAWELIETNRDFIASQFLDSIFRPLIEITPVMPLPMPLLMTFNFIIATIFMFYVGRDYIAAIPRFLTGRGANMDTLVGIGTLTAYVYSAAIFLFPQISTVFGLSKIYYFDATVIVISFIFIGKYLEAKAKRKTNEAISLLIGLQTKSALIDSYGIEKEIDINDLKTGDIMIVKPGMKVPADGEIVFGSTSLDESMITGESLPADKKEGDKVIGGTLNKQGFIKVRAMKVGSDTLLAHIIRTVEEAQSSKAPIQKLADRISSLFVPAVIAVALITLFSWTLYGYAVGDVPQYFAIGLTTFVAVLVIACPCALGLATPLGIIVGTGLAGRRGILIKNAESLEKLHSVKTVVFDKTGTITKGVPEVADLSAFGISESEILDILRSLESNSEHPLARAVCEYQNGGNVKQVIEFNNRDGLGVEGIIDGKKYYAGNIKFYKNTAGQADNGLVIRLNDLAEQGKTPVILFDSEKALGFVTLADTIKDNSADTIRELHSLGIKTVMLTGDHKNVAEFIGKQAGIDEIIADVRPDDKADVIRKLKESSGVTAMIGDGINDAPALATADISVAMSTGSDIAIESADITILHGDLAKILKAIKISRLTMRKIKQNLFWAFAYNIILIPLACGLLYISTGLLLNPVLAGFAMAMSSISVVTNTLLMRFSRI